MIIRSYCETHNKGSIPHSSRNRSQEVQQGRLTRRGKLRHVKSKPPARQYHDCARIIFILVSPQSPSQWPAPRELSSACQHRQDRKSTGNKDSPFGMIAKWAVFSIRRSHLPGIIQSDNSRAVIPETHDERFYCQGRFSSLCALPTISSPVPTLPPGRIRWSALTVMERRWVVCTDICSLMMNFVPSGITIV